MLGEKPLTDKHTTIYHEFLYIADFCKVIPEESQTNTQSPIINLFFLKTLTVETIENSQEK